MATATKKPAAQSKKNSSVPFWQKTSSSTPTSKSDNSTTTIGKGLSIEGGTIKGEGNVCVDGYFVGDIEITGDVSIGASGAVYGDINANRATISGNSKGLIKTTSKIHMTSTAVVEGAVASNAVVIDEGAVFNGSCKMETDVQLPDANTRKS